MTNENETCFGAGITRTRTPRWNLASGTIYRYLVGPLLLAGLTACASSGNQEDEQTPGPANCIVVEVQNTSLTGVTVWTQWENRTPRRQGRVSLNGRRVYTLPFRNAIFNLQFQAEGQTVREGTNVILPQPGDRIDIVYRNDGPGQLRRIGPARCP